MLLLSASGRTVAGGFRGTGTGLFGMFLEHGSGIFDNKDHQRGLDQVDKGVGQDN